MGAEVDLSLFEVMDKDRPLSAYREFQFGAVPPGRGVQVGKPTLLLIDAVNFFGVNDIL